MSFSDVKKLREAGKLEEALQMAQQNLEAKPDNIWNKRAIAWVYYDYLKNNTGIEKYQVFKEYLAKLKALDLPSDEHMIFDSCSYHVGKVLFSIGSSEPIDYRKLDEIFELIRDFHFSKPSEGYSFLLKAFHKSYKNWTNYLGFAEWWGFDYFRSEDYLPEEYNGKKIMSIVEQAYIAYSRKLLEGESHIVDGLILPKTIDKSKITEFLTKLDVIVESHPEYQYPPYFKAKLLLAIGEKENVLSAFIPFARMKRNDFWVWDLLSEIFPVDDNRRFACLCKALTLRTPEDFLIRLRQKMAKVLVDKTKYNEAKTEIEKIIAVINEHQWNIPPQVQNWTKTEWYKQAIANKNNLLFYKQFSSEAEEILFAEIPEELVVVEYVNEAKSMISFVKDKAKSGFFNFQGLINKPSVGEIYMVRFVGDPKDNFYKIVSARKITEKVDSPAILRFSGKVKKSGDFCFVENVFINPELSAKNTLNQNDNVKGVAILSFNKKKNDWGWKAVSISK